MQSANTVTIFGCAERVEVGRLVVPSWSLRSAVQFHAEPPAPRLYSEWGRAPLLGPAGSPAAASDAGYLGVAEMTLKSAKISVGCYRDCRFE